MLESFKTKPESNAADAYRLRDPGRRTSFESWREHHLFQPLLDLPTDIDSLTVFRPCNWPHIVMRCCSRVLATSRMPNASSTCNERSVHLCSRKLPVAFHAYMLVQPGRLTASVDHLQSITMMHTILFKSGRESLPPKAIRGFCGNVSTMEARSIRSVRYTVYI